MSTSPSGSGFWVRVRSVFLYFHHVVHVQRRMEDLVAIETEVKELIQISEDDVAQVNDLLSVLQDSKEARTKQLFSVREPHQNDKSDASSNATFCVLAGLRAFGSTARWRQDAAG